MFDPGITLNSPLSRRKALTMGGGLAGALVASSLPMHALLSKSVVPRGIFSMNEEESKSGGLPVKQIEEIIGAEGTVSNGVLNIQVDRNDLNVVGPGNIPFKPAWEINHEFFFQSLGDGKAIFNGDICVLASESNHTIDRILTSGLTFMAFHMHFVDLQPQVWFQHFRGIGDPIRLAKAIRFVLGATSTPLPQPPSPKDTPLNADRLADILGGSAEVEGDGVVVVSVSRKESIELAGHHVKSELGIESTIAFEPLDGAEHCAVAPDFALLGKEVNPVFTIMRGQNFQIHCLYNQETDEKPQFYFSHQLKVGNAYDLARQIRRGLNHTNSDFSS